MIVIYEKYLRVHVCIGAAINYFELNLNWIEKDPLTAMSSATMLLTMKNSWVHAFQ